MAGEKCVWSFSYGSNMDVVALQKKKKVHVLEQIVRHPPHRYPPHQTIGIDAGLKRELGSEVHGIAFYSLTTTAQNI